MNIESKEYKELKVEVDKEFPGLLEIIEQQTQEIRKAKSELEKKLERATTKNEEKKNRITIQLQRILIKTSKIQQTNVKQEIQEEIENLHKTIFDTSKINANKFLTKFRFNLSPAGSVFHSFLGNL